MPPECFEELEGTVKLYSLTSGSCLNFSTNSWTIFVEGPAPAISWFLVCSAWACGAAPQGRQNPNRQTPAQRSRPVPRRSCSSEETTRSPDAPSQSLAPSAFGH